MRKRKPVATKVLVPDESESTRSVKVTRDDWLNVAIDVLISDGIEQVKVLPLAEHLDVSRSSFYWYFKSRQALLDTLLDHWKNTNSAALIAQADLPVATITAAVCNVFRCVIDSALFDNRLDFAIRDWARRSGPVRHVLDLSDQQRLDALSAMFARYGYERGEAITRARVLYYMQIGYNAADMNEPMVERLQYLPEYLLCFTGKTANEAEVQEFRAYAHSLP